MTRIAHTHASVCMNAFLNFRQLWLVTLIINVVVLRNGPAKVFNSNCAMMLTSTVTPSNTKPISNKALGYRSPVASLNSLAMTLARV